MRRIVILGRGRPLSEAPEVRISLRREETRRSGNGVVPLHYTSNGA